MKYLIAFLLLVCLASAALAQDHSGTYGYILKLEGAQPPKDKTAIPGGQLVLQKMEGNKYRFWLDVLNGPPGYNRGETDGTIVLVNDTASIDNTFEGAIVPCILRFKKNGNTINIYGFSTAHSCGFGNGVTADGNYTWMKPQQVINNEWLKKEYPESPMAKAEEEKVELFQDEMCLHSFSPKRYFTKGNTFLAIAENDNSVYTEHFTAPGKFVWGWMKKEQVKILPAR